MSVVEHMARLAKLGSADAVRLGGKNASLGEMIRALTNDGVRRKVNIRQRRWSS